MIVVAATCLAGAPAARAATIDLPTPDAARLTATDLLRQLGVRPDRLLRSSVPGPVVNTERVLVGLLGDGSIATVQVEQRLRLTGEGDYAVRERGPARSAVSLSSEPPPVTRLGAVVWQGFSPGSRDLAAVGARQAGRRQDSCSGAGAVQRTGQ